MIITNRFCSSLLLQNKILQIFNIAQMAILGKMIKEALLYFAIVAAEITFLLGSEPHSSKCLARSMIFSKNLSWLLIFSFLVVESSSSCSLLCEPTLPLSLLGFWKRFLVFCVCLLITDGCSQSAQETTFQRLCYIFLLHRI